MKIIQLETQGLILRNLAESDAKVLKYVRGYTHKNAEEIKEYIREKKVRCKN